jgi:trans-2,3-dihydro-3-hydroxyanthranilate isomerase
MQYKFYIVDVFSATPFGGNQLAVLPQAAGIGTAGMQAIAREFNFAETAFVLPAADKAHTCRVRIFTPRAEMPFAGHPTIGTACALVQGGHAGPGFDHELTLEEPIGPVRVAVTEHAGILTGALTLHGKPEQPRFAPDKKDLADVLSLPHTDVLHSFFAGFGARFCFAHLASREAVDRAALNRAAWSKALAHAWSPHVHMFSGNLDDGSELYARMFAPALGIEEDAATGSGAAVLAGVLAGRPTVADGRFTLSIVQGVAMGRRSEMRPQPKRSRARSSRSMSAARPLLWPREKSRFRQR